MALTLEYVSKRAPKYEEVRQKREKNVDERKIWKQIIMKNEFQFRNCHLHVGLSLEFAQNAHQLVRRFFGSLFFCLPFPVSPSFARDWQSHEKNRCYNTHCLDFTPGKTRKNITSRFVINSVLNRKKKQQKTMTKKTRASQKKIYTNFQFIFGDIDDSQHNGGENNTVSFFVRFIFKTIKKMICIHFWAL